MSKRSIVFTIIGILLVWQLAAFGVNSNLLPAPAAVLTSFVQGLGGKLGLHIAVSSWRLITSMVLAVLLAVPLGLVIGQSKGLDALVAPLIYITYPIPKVVLLPVVMLFLGIGDRSKIFIITLILFFQILVVVRDASHGVRPELIYSVRSLGATRFQVLRYVYIPACLPSTLTALRVSTGTAVAVLYVAESFATQSGLGFYIMDTWQALAYPKMYSAVVAMSVIGFAVYVGLDHLETRFCGWVHAGK